MNFLRACAKACAAAATGAVGALLTANSDGTVTTVEWVIVGLTAVGALGIVWRVPNTDPTGTRQDESVQPPGPTAVPEGGRMLINAAPGRAEEIAAALSRDAYRRRLSDGGATVVHLSGEEHRP